MPTLEFILATIIIGLWIVGVLCLAGLFKRQT